MLIVNDEQLRSVGIKSLSKRCPYCSKALAAYPLILSDDAGLFVYHAACAAALATEILVDLYTFFSPPAPTTSSLFSRHLAQFLLLRQNTIWHVKGTGGRIAHQWHRKRSDTCNQRISAAIKAALVEQAFLGTAQVSCPMGPVVAVRRRKGQLLVMIRGWGRWYPVESVRIERMVVSSSR